MIVSMSPCPQASYIVNGNTTEAFSNTIMCPNRDIFLQRKYASHV